MSPQDKLAAIARQAAAGHKVLMIGDGLNDGPALAAGYASIAPGSASDAGKNAADCIFLGDRLMPVMLAIRVARRTQAIVRQNFALRSEERRVGKGWVSTCRSWGSPYH